MPSAAAIPGLGLPMENNIFLNANYGWAYRELDQVDGTPTRGCSARRAEAGDHPTRRIPFDRTRLVSRQLQAGSRILVGGDVSDESIADARQPLHLRWYGDSAIRLPIADASPAAR